MQSPQVAIVILIEIQTGIGIQMIAIVIETVGIAICRVILLALGTATAGMTS